MTRRIRLVASVLALLSLTLSFAESVWASTCAMPTSAPTEVEASPSTTPVGMHIPSHDPTHDLDPAQDEGPCPFGSPVAAQVCLGIVSLPATTALLPATLPRDMTEVFALHPVSDLLLESTLFRPPRA